MTTLIVWMERMRWIVVRKIYNDRISLFLRDVTMIKEYETSCGREIHTIFNHLHMSFILLFESNQIFPFHVIRP
jgi:hypothetical protein